MMHTKRQFFIFGSALLSLSACGMKDASNPLARPTSASGSISSTDVASAILGDDSFENFSTAALQSTDGSEMGDIGEVDSTLLSRIVSLKHDFPMSVAMSSACDPTTDPASPVDSDLDGIPLTVTKTFSCSETTAFGPMTLNGTVALEDLNDGNIFGGFAAGVSNLIFTLDYGQGTSISTTMNADISSTKGNSTYSGSYDIAGTVSVASPAQSATLNYGVFLDISVTPNSMSSPADSGSLTTFSGFYKFNVSGTQNFNLVLAVSSSNLKYTKAGGSCSQAGLRDGSLSLTDGSGNVLKATYASNCSVVYTFNDEVVTPEEDNLRKSLLSVK